MSSLTKPLSTPRWPSLTRPRFSTEVDRNTLGFAFIIGALSIFVRFSYLHEILVVLTGARLFILYIFGVPAILAVLMTGGIRNAFRGRPALFWLAFTFWIVVAIPFSVWPGGSFGALMNYVKVGPVVLLTIAGLTTNWRQCKAMMWVFAGAACAGLLMARLFQAETGGRVGLEFGSIQNSNDFSAHLLFLLPFLLWIVLGSRSVVLRILALLALGFGVNIILQTASRGAMVSMLLGLAFFWWRSSARQRLASLCLVTLTALLLLVNLPKEKLIRLGSFTYSFENAITREATASSATRQYLMQKGIQYTIEHPIFGVGPGLFMSYEGGREKTVGTRGMYYAPHNSFLQVSSECGIPALLFYLAAIVATWRLLNGIYKESVKRRDCEDITTAVSCVMLAILAFSSAAFFLSLAYTFYLPAMTGLAIAMAGAAKQEFQSRSTLTTPGTPQQSPFKLTRQFAPRVNAPAITANAPQRRVR